MTNYNDTNDSDYYSAIGEYLNKNLSAEKDLFVKIQNKTRSKHRRTESDTEQHPEPKKNSKEKTPEEKLVSVPKDLVEDFAVLQLLPGSSLRLCKNSWRRLLKKFHPDTVTIMKSISEEEAANVVRRLNNAYKRIEHWYETGQILKIK